MTRPGKIVAVGRNYSNHARELGNEVPSVPLLFLKPPSAVIGDGDTILLPAESSQVDYEGEVVVILKSPLRRATPQEAMAAIEGVCCGNDVTARDLQKSEPQWTRAKGFDTFAALGSVVPGWDGQDDLTVITRVNGKERQRGSTTDMIFSVPTLLSFISYTMTLEAGDAIFTGTPEGVGPLSDGDVVEVEIPGVGVLRNSVVAESFASTHPLVVARAR